MPKIGDSGVLKPFWTTSDGTTVRLYHGHVTEVLAKMPAKSVHCCVTSPPYWGLRSYATGDHKHHEIGAEPSPDCGTQGRSQCGRCFVCNMVAVFRGVHRVLRDDGTLFLNLGDSYSSSVHSEDACGTSDKVLEDSQGSDCLCGSLCGACRKAYQIGKSHSDIQHVPKPTSSPSLSSLLRKESSTFRSPTLGSSLLGAHNSISKLGSRPLKAPAYAQHLVSSLSKPSLSSQLHREDSPQLDSASGCLVCGCSLTSCEILCECKTAYTFDTGQPQGTSSVGKSDTASLESAYLGFTTKSPKRKGLPSGNLVGVPWRVALALQADGWILRQDIIWHKPSPMPESVKNRCTKAHEYVFLFAKKQGYFYDAEAIKEKAKNPTELPGNFVVKAGGNSDRGDQGRSQLANDATTSNKRSVWTMSSTVMKLRDDLTPEQKTYVLGELVRRGLL